MRKKFFCITAMTVWVVLWISGCFQKPFANNDSDYLKLIDFLQDEVIYPTLLLEKLSPNGYWYLHTDVSAGSLSLGSPINSEESVLLEKTAFSKTIPEISSWSPDSTALVINLATDITHKSRGIILYDFSTNDVSRYEFDLPEIGYVTTIWSPDSQHLAVFFNDETIYILNRDGKTLNILDFSREEGAIGKSVWPGTGLIVQYTSAESGVPSSAEVRVYENILTSDNFNVILSIDEPFVRYLHLDKETNQILLNSCSDSNAYQECNLLIFDSENKDIKKIIFPYHLASFKVSDDMRWVAIAVSNQNPSNPPFKLFLVDMQTQSVIEKYDCHSLFDWISSEEGFLTLVKKDEKYIVDLLTP